ncbi:MAG: flagellar protein FlgN [Synergistaceae bacterium]|jgi:hypothetical protein|nr:flagellar protein FlgN [Synergistaceae bacterium]
MSEKPEALIETLKKQDDILSELLSITLKQREALKDGRLSDLQDLMSEMRHTSVRAQAIEAKRSRAAAVIANDLGCGATVSDILRAIPEEHSAAMDEAAKKLLSTVEKLKMEMSLLSRLMDEAKTLNEMMITEWRKLGAQTAGLPMSGFDTRI